MATMMRTTNKDAWGLSDSLTSARSAPMILQQSSLVVRSSGTTPMKRGGRCASLPVINSGTATPPRSILRVTSLQNSLHRQGLAKSTDKRRIEISEDVSVGWGSIHVRDYERAIGDNPSVSAGPPISIGWDYVEYEDVALDDYEVFRTNERRERQELIIPREVRFRMLHQEWDLSHREIATAVRKAIKAKNLRRQTVTNLKSERIELVMENVRDGLRKANCCHTGGKSGSGVMDAVVTDAYRPPRGKRRGSSTAEFSVASSQKSDLDQTRHNQVALEGLEEASMIVTVSKSLEDHEAIGMDLDLDDDSGHDGGHEWDDASGMTEDPSTLIEDENDEVKDSSHEEEPGDDIDEASSSAVPSSIPSNPRQLETATTTTTRTDGMVEAAEKVIHTEEKTLQSTMTNQERRISHSSSGSENSSSLPAQ